MSVVFTLLDNQVNRSLTHIFNRCQAKADAAADSGEHRTALVDIRRQHFNAVAAALVDKLDHTVDGVNFAGEQGRHKLDGKVGFEISRLVGNQRIGGAVGFIEAVATEFFDQVEQIGGNGLVHTVFYRTVDELLPVFGHQGFNLLADGLAQTVRIGHGITGQLAGHLHDLFLVDHHPVGFLEDRFQAGHRVDNLLAAVFTVHKIVDHTTVQRAGTIQRDQCGEVVKRFRMQADQQVLHAAGFQLKHAGGVSGLEQGKCFFVVIGQVGQVRCGLPLGGDAFQRVVDDGQVA